MLKESVTRLTTKNQLLEKKVIELESKLSDENLKELIIKLSKN